MNLATVYAGGPRTARATLINRQLAEHWGRAILIVPTQAAARQRLAQVMQQHALPGTLGRPVIDFKSFTESILKGEGETVMLASDLRRRLVLESVLRELHSLDAQAGFPNPANGRGLVSHLLEVITQLKQAALEPAEFRARIAASETPNPLDPMIAAAYEAYQASMISHGHYDVPGLYWRAHDIATATAPRALNDLELLIFDGFDDFTPSELRLITALAPHVPKVIFGLAFDPNSDRHELFGLARRTLDRLRQHFTIKQPDLETAPPQRLSDFVADHLFWRSRPPASIGLEEDLRVLACIDLQHEAESLARHAYTLLARGVAPTRIALVYRNLAEAAPWLRAAMAEFGVPAHFAQGPALRESLPANVLCAALGIAPRWEREKVGELIANPGFAPGGERDPLWSDAAWIARRAGVLDGRVAWAQRLDLHMRYADDSDERTAAGALRAAVAALGNALDKLPQEATLSLHCAAAAKLLDALGVEAALNAMASRGAAGIEGERYALRVLRGILGELAQASSDTYTLEDFAVLLEQALQDTHGFNPGDPEGVQVLDAPNARHLAFDHVLFGGLNEGAVPQPAAINAIYGEIERARLGKVGVELERREDRAAREIALFHHVIGLPRAGLVLSYQLNEGGREAAASPYLVQLRELIAHEHPEAIEAPPLADSFLPALDAAASLREARNAAFFARAEGTDTMFPGPGAAARIERSRYAAVPFAEFDGVLAEASAHARLAATFGTSHVFSVAQIEDYTVCPFQFFLTRVIGAVEEDPPEAELDPRTRGGLLHRVLQLFHEEHAGHAVAELDPAQASARFVELIGQVFTEQSRKLEAVPAGILHAERQRLDLLLRRYFVRAAEKHGEQWKPAFFEVAFGPARNDVGEREDRPPLALETAEGTVLFSGRIDRIDQDGDALRLIDYKSGSPPKAADITQGTSLQLAVYAIACEHLLFPGKTCNDALYVKVGGAREQPGLKTKDADRGAIEAAALAMIARSLQGIRGGVFPPLPTGKTCYGCTTAHICRHERARIERKPVPALLAGAARPPGEDEDEDEI